MSLAKVFRAQAHGLQAQGKGRSSGLNFVTPADTKIIRNKTNNATPQNNMDVVMAKTNPRLNVSLRLLI